MMQFDYSNNPYLQIEDVLPNPQNPDSEPYNKCKFHL